MKTIACVFTAGVLLFSFASAAESGVESSARGAVTLADSVRLSWKPCVQNGDLIRANRLLVTFEEEVAQGRASRKQLETLVADPCFRFADALLPDTDELFAFWKLGGNSWLAQGVKYGEKRWSKYQFPPLVQLEGPIEYPVYKGQLSTCVACSRQVERWKSETGELLENWSQLMRLRGLVQRKRAVTIEDCAVEASASEKSKRFADWRACVDSVAESVLSIPKRVPNEVLKGLLVLQYVGLVCGSA
jgi:hypothetical protein